MSEIDSLAFQAGQQVRCKTKFNHVLNGEVVAFDLNSKILAIKSTQNTKTAQVAPASSNNLTSGQANVASSSSNLASSNQTQGAQTTQPSVLSSTSSSSANIQPLTANLTSTSNNTFDIHFLVLDSVSDVKILKESPEDYNANNLPSIDMKSVEMRKTAARDERLKLVESFANGVSKDGLLLFAEFSKKYSSGRDVEWQDKNKIVVLKQVVISPPYREVDCQPLDSKTSTDAVPYIKKVVSHYWESKSR